MKDDIVPITFKTKIVCYPKHDNQMMTLSQCKEIVDSGQYEIEFIMGFELEPTIIIKPKK